MIAWCNSANQSNLCIGEGDSRIIYNVFSEQMSVEVFAQLKAEVQWQQMQHAGGIVPRLVCCQASIYGQDGTTPLYRHPSDEALPTKSFTQTVDGMRREVEQVAGHQINHVLIQLYRSGEDFISEHSDKTLDIARNSSKLTHSRHTYSGTSETCACRSPSHFTASAEHLVDMPSMY